MRKKHGHQPRRLWNEHIHFGFGRETQGRQGEVERREEHIEGPDPRDGIEARDEAYHWAWGEQGHLWSSYQKNPWFLVIFNPGDLGLYPENNES